MIEYFIENVKHIREISLKAKIYIKIVVQKCRLLKFIRVISN